jgi:hypothetical protein
MQPGPQKRLLHNFFSVFVRGRMFPNEWPKLLVVQMIERCEGLFIASGEPLQQAAFIIVENVLQSVLISMILNGNSALAKCNHFEHRGIRCIQMPGRNLVVK